MKKYSLLLPAFLILSACSAHIPVGTPTPREEYREEYYYTFSGQVLSENGTPMSNIGVTMEEKNLYSTDKRDDQFITTKTNDAGNFYFTVKRNRKGILRISNELLVDENIRFKGPADSTPYDTGREDFSVLLDEGTAYQHFTNVARGNSLEIRVPYSNMGIAFHEIKRLYERDQNYREAVHEARSFLETFKNSNSAYVAEIRRMAFDAEKGLQWKMRSEFNTLLALNEKRDFESVIYKGRDYIREYRDVRDSRWEEVRELVGQAEHSRHEAEHYRREEEYSRHADENSRHEAERHEHEAENSRHEIDGREKYKAIISLKETDYDAIISQGRAYIEEYGGLENSHSGEVEKLVSAAETRKRLAEGREKGLERQEKTAKEQASKEKAAREQFEMERAAKDQAAKEQAAKDQAAKDQGAKKQAETEKVTKEQVGKEKALKEQADKDKASKEQVVKEKSAQDKAAKEQPAKKQVVEEKTAKERGGKEKASKEKTTKEQAAKEQGTKEKAEKEKEQKSELN